jgi:hypothetical protein
MVRYLNTAERVVKIAAAILRVILEARKLTR